MDFKKSLEFGKIYESETLKYLEYDNVEFSIGKCKEWDIKTTKDNKETYYEIKADLVAYKYGNLCIEFKCSNVDSGISSSIADYWVYYVIKNKEKKLYDVYKIPTDDIKTLIKNKSFHRKVRCGDYNNAECYLFSSSLFSNYKLLL